MKNIAFIGLMLFSIPVSSQVKSVTLTEAGTLSQYISNSEKSTIKELKISGPINGTDICLIRSMACAKPDFPAEEAQEYNICLEVLDLSNAQIKEGGDVYLRNVGGRAEWIVEKDNDIPPYFLYCGYSSKNSLRKLLLPSNVETIGKWAFTHHTELSKVVIEDGVTTIDDRVFASCRKLETIDLPSSLRKIGDGVWTESGLKFIRIPEGVESVGDAFSHTRYLREIHVPSTVTTFGSNPFINCSSLSAVYWNAKIKLEATVVNQFSDTYANFLVFAPSDEYVSEKCNLVVNGVAEKLNFTTDDLNAGGFYSPEPFFAKEVNFTKSNFPGTKVGECCGWSTIALPFAPQTISHETKGSIVPYSTWKKGDIEKPFWLYEFSDQGFVPASKIEAYTPYIISMPSDYEAYGDLYYLGSGDIIFSAQNVQFEATDNVVMQQPSCNGKTFTPSLWGCYTDDLRPQNIFAINDRDSYGGTFSMGDWWEEGYNGSQFVHRRVFAFEAYMTTETSNSRKFLEIFEDGGEMPTLIWKIASDKTTLSEQTTISNLSASFSQRVNIDKMKEQISKLPKGIYIIGNRKIIIPK